MVVRGEAPGLPDALLEGAPAAPSALTFGFLDAHITWRPTSPKKGCLRYDSRHQERFTPSRCLCNVCKDTITSREEARVRS